METARSDLSVVLPGSARARGVLVRPVEDESRSRPGVVMLHEIFGIDEVLLRNADRLAAMGYLVLVPDLFGEGNRLGCIAGAFRALRSERGRPFEVISACQDVLRAQPECSGRLGVIGFCMGGGFALLSAARGFEVASINYGQQPKELDAVLVGACPIVASYGQADTTLRGAARRLGEALTEADIAHDVKEYSGAGHGFMNDAPNGPKAMRIVARASGIGPEPEAAADAWGRIERFFARQLSD